MNNKILIYQVFTRLYGNRNETRKQWGTYTENGSGKFNDFDRTTLISRIWDFPIYGLPAYCVMLRRPIIPHTTFPVSILLW